MLVEGVVVVFPKVVAILVFEEPVFVFSKLPVMVVERVVDGFGEVTEITDVEGMVFIRVVAVVI